MNRTDMLLSLALDEDIGGGDVTAAATIGPDVRSRAVVFGREPFVLAGSAPFRRIFELLDRTIVVQAFFKDGDLVPPDTTVFLLEGPARPILTGERTALNFLQRLSGIATLTRKMVDAIAGTNARLLDTRKTTPLWRALEKEAVRAGGGVNHRFGLFDGVLIKDNHLAAARGVANAVSRARQHAPHTLRIEVEVESIQQLQEALKAGADVVLLDNFTLENLGSAVRENAGRTLLEASGGVTLENIRAIAETGVDFISSGSITHSARAIDLTMEFAFSE